MSYVGQLDYVIMNNGEKKVGTTRPCLLAGIVADAAEIASCLIINWPGAGRECFYPPLPEWQLKSGASALGLGVFVPMGYSHHSPRLALLSIFVCSSSDA